MDGKLNFSDYITIAVCTVALYWLVDHFLKRKTGCGCGAPAAPGKANPLPAVTTRRACA